MRPPITPAPTPRRSLAIKALLAAAALLATAAAPPAPPAHTLSVTLLGTKGGPVADAARSEPASLLVIDGRPYLVDAGEGTARQLAAAGWQPADIHRIFLTHHHLDHTAGLEPLIGLSWIGAGLAGRSDRTEIYGPPATQALVGAALDYLAISQRIFAAGIPSLPPAAAMFAGHDLDPAGAPPAYADEAVRVTVVENSHFSHASASPSGVRDRSLSYRFDTPAGSVVFTGDTGPSEAVARLARGADLLVSEVYTPASVPAAAGTGAVGRELADHLTREHLTPEAVGQLAAAAGVKAVLLTHLVTTEDRNLARTLRERIARHYAGPVTVGHDLLTYQLPPRG